MIDYPTCIAAVFVAVLFGGAVGVFLAQQHAARDLARLRLLVPEARLLRDAAAVCRSWNWYSTASQLKLLAARIEAAGAGAESVPTAWEQTPTRRE